MRKQLTVRIPLGKCYVKKSQMAVETQRRVSTPSGSMLSGGDCLAGNGEPRRRGVPRVRTVQSRAEKTTAGSVNCKQPRTAGCRVGGEGW